MCKGPDISEFGLF
uniref:Uncharacterized protein n=1 Tax=Rhizophora mucronata TaxID=61149 RepID=A0A2P2NPX0_RHIMU